MNRKHKINFKINSTVCHFDANLLENFSFIINIFQFFPLEFVYSALFANEK